MFAAALCASCMDAPATQAQTAVASSAGVPVPAGWVAAGQARLSVWGFEVYDARLWVEPAFRATDFAAAEFVLELSYLRSFEGQAIAKRSLDEMRRQGEIPPAQAAAWLQAMTRLFPDVRKGDRITGIHRAGRARFFHNGKLLGEMDDATFSRRFFGIWLAPETSEPGMRSALLANAP